MTDSKKIRVAIIGATAYTSREAIRWLLRHPAVEITALCSRREPQPRIDEIFPDLTGLCSLRCQPIDPAALRGQADVAFLCLPNGYGRTKLTNAYFERALRTPATTRNWRTVTALAGMCRCAGADDAPALKGVTPRTPAAPGPGSA